MKISEVKRKLANILEVPEEPIELGKEIGLGRGEERGLFRKNSPILRDILVKAFTLECIWEEFEKALEKEGKGLDEDFTLEELNLFRSLIKRFFARIRIPRGDIKRDKERLLEAIEILEKDLFQ